MRPWILLHKKDFNFTLLKDKICSWCTMISKYNSGWLLPYPGRRQRSSGEVTAPGEILRLAGWLVGQVARCMSYHRGVWGFKEEAQVPQDNVAISNLSFSTLDSSGYLWKYSRVEDRIRARQMCRWRCSCRSRVSCLLAVKRKWSNLPNHNPCLPIFGELRHTLRSGVRNK